jgi:hypothetical protein
LSALQDLDWRVENLKCAVRTAALAPKLSVAQTANISILASQQTCNLTGTSDLASLEVYVEWVRIPHGDLNEDVDTILEWRFRRRAALRWPRL